MLLSAAPCFIFIYSGRSHLDSSSRSTVPHPQEARSGLTDPFQCKYQVRCPSGYSKQTSTRTGTCTDLFFSSHKQPNSNRARRPFLMLKQRKAKIADEMHKIAKQLSPTGLKATQALKVCFVGMLIFESRPQLVKYWWFGTVPKPTYDPIASLFEEPEMRLRNQWTFTLRATFYCSATDILKFMEVFHRFIS